MWNKIPNNNAWSCSSYSGVFLNPPAFSYKIEDLFSVGIGAIVEDFGRLVARRQAARLGAHAHHRREVAHAPVQFGQHQRGDEVERGRVDQNLGGLQGLCVQRDLPDQRLELRQEGLIVIELHRQRHHLVHWLPGQGFNLRLLLGGERVREVEQDHRVNPLLALGKNRLDADGLYPPALPGWNARAAPAPP